MEEEIPDEEEGTGEGCNIKEKEEARNDLIYGMTDSPPLHITIICGLQTVLITLTSGLFVSLLVAQVVCASHNDVFKARLLSSTLFMNGFTTLAMNLIGVRLALYQGAAGEYAIPLLLIGTVDSSFCSSKSSTSDSELQIMVNATLNTTSTESVDADLERTLFNVRALQGSLMVAGIIHGLLGFTGLVGILLNFIGPITIVSSMVLLSVILADACIGFVQGHWAIGLSTAGLGIILSVYLANHKMPIPIWTPALGCRTIWYPLHQVFALLISVLVNWCICGVLTSTGMLTDDPENIQYETRTDARIKVIADSPWFNIPYPGQYGMISFSGPAFVAFFIATVISILDSLGDYFACARTCRVPPPPTHAVNRGIMVEGFCTFLSGTVGCGHATTTYGDTIGVIAITKVASRHVFICAGILYILFGVTGKFSAVFITIPNPVLGGAAIVMFSTFLGVALSNLQVVSLSSSRNMTILGLAIFLGLMIPKYVNSTEEPFDTGNETFDRFLVMVLSNVNFCGPMIAFFLDNTIPGTKEERGISAWQLTKPHEHPDTAGPDIYGLYVPLIPRKFLNYNIVKYIPFLPHLKRRNVNVQTETKL